MRLVLCDRYVTHSRHRTYTGGHRRTRRRFISRTGGTSRIPKDTRRHAITAARDRASEGGRGPDSQADSHSVGHRQPSANVSGSQLVTLHLARTSLDGGGRRKRGLQNRLWSSADVHPSSLSSAGVRFSRRGRPRTAKLEFGARGVAGGLSRLARRKRSQTVF